jgi:hypothetical protein
VYLKNRPILLPSLPLLFSANKLSERRDCTCATRVEERASASLRARRALINSISFAHPRSGPKRVRYRLARARKEFFDSPRRIGRISSLLWAAVAIKQRDREIAQALRLEGGSTNDPAIFERALQPKISWTRPTTVAS